MPNQFDYWSNKVNLCRESFSLKIPVFHGCRLLCQRNKIGPMTTLGFHYMSKDTISQVICNMLCCVMKIDIGRLRVNKLFSFICFIFYFSFYFILVLFCLFVWVFLVFLCGGSIFKSSLTNSAWKNSSFCRLNQSLILYPLTHVQQYSWWMVLNWKKKPPAIDSATPKPMLSLWNSTMPQVDWNLIYHNSNRWPSWIYANKKQLCKKSDTIILFRMICFRIGTEYLNLVGRHWWPIYEI